MVATTNIKDPQVHARAVTERPLLCKGDDFVPTDLVLAAAPRSR